MQRNRHGTAHCVSISVGMKRTTLTQVLMLMIENAVLLSTVTASSYYEELEFYLKSGQEDSCYIISGYILWLKMVSRQRSNQKNYVSGMVKSSKTMVK